MKKIVLYLLSLSILPSVLFAQDFSKIQSVPLDRMLIEIDLTKQVVNFIDRAPDDKETVVCTVLCSTGAEKFAKNYPKGSSGAARTCNIIASGNEGPNGLRISEEAGGARMTYYLELGIYYPDGVTSRAIGLHADTSDSEHVSRIPASMGCIRLPTAVARVLYMKVRGNAPLGKVEKSVPVRFVGEVQSLW